MDYSIDTIGLPAEKLVEISRTRPVLALHGEMGAGKTTLVKKVCSILGVKENVSSPTFSIINEYTMKNEKTIYHIDLYRLRSVDEAISAGVMECIYSGDPCVVEWPELINALLPPDTIHCFLSTIDSNCRKLRINL